MRIAKTDTNTTPAVRSTRHCRPVGQPRRVLAATAAGAALLLLAACGSKSQTPVAQTPVVTVVTVHPRSVPYVSEVPGRVNAKLVAEVRARVDGIVQSRDFTEGAEVKAGQRLYRIDPAPYEAAYHSAQASLAKARANLASVAAQAERYKTLVAANAVSQQDYDNAVAALGQAQADVQAGQAAVDTARINLGYTSVTAPISGRIGISNVTPGAYVQASAATLMSTVQQIDPVYVDLTQSSLDGLRLRDALAKGQLQSADSNRAQVRLTLEDGSLYPLPGTLQFSDITVDQSTGSVTVRALFPNPKHLLLPGMFVRAALTEGFSDGAMVVPAVGVIHDQKGEAVSLVVGADDKVAVRKINATRTLGNDWVVESGLRDGDRVIVGGQQQVRPGVTVKVVEAPASADAASGAQAIQSARTKQAAQPAPGSQRVSAAPAAVH
jgi:membrane fusion protein (multidrug efflux system)